MTLHNSKLWKLSIIIKLEGKYKVKGGQGKCVGSQGMEEQNEQEDIQFL